MFSGFGSNFFGGASFAPINSKFEDYFRCYPVAMMPDNVRKDDSNFGGKIFLPSSALNKLTMLHIRYPMLFELTNEAENLTSHSGVLEFVAEEGRAYLPQWTMETLKLQPGSLIKIASCDLPNGQFVKLEPQSVEFLDISDPKAVLENALRKFSTLTVNDVIEIDYNDTRFGIKVLEVKPESTNKGICVVETDLETDFAPPVGYVEPEYKPKGAKSSASPIDPKKVNRSAGAATMAHSIGYANIVHEGNNQKVYKGTGQKLSGKEVGSHDTKRITIDDLDPNATPVELNLPENQIFLGWPVVLPVLEKKEESAPSVSYQGEGKSLRQSKKRTTVTSNSGHDLLKNHSRSPDYIEIDD
ncbi:UFD1-domain-containing protein [Metschnikowia bicuspidata var. bicuspidata NRRL YB-4993]|uniref:Ubiquitin fusion degradation protein 1 n=1 Tax=Metschnikowia bicuspidata var. bicuspidata NRRL YB-4993 TaxID=869754 RepID=A0A1A0HHF9_9ASCO|nr:UFD1-domain-containing protein [Metschnikowia bicuspidata var. bicuspidata NRRL YB-4993]OBA23441.1 UFD1-domain-containing protein [Metschnikowia bicuspidata var. bicuspidata NRRL YB-4993]